MALTSRELQDINTSVSGLIKNFHSNIISLTLWKSFAKKIGSLQKEDCGSHYLICVKFWWCHLQTCCCFYLKTSQWRLPLSSLAYYVGREQLWSLQKCIIGTSIYLFTEHWSVNSLHIFLCCLTGFRAPIDVPFNLKSQEYISIMESLPFVVVLRAQWMTRYAL